MIKTIKMSTFDVCCLKDDLKKGRTEPIKSFFKTKCDIKSTNIPGLEILAKGVSSVDLLQDMIDGNSNSRMWYNVEENSINFFDGKDLKTVILKS